MKIQLEQGALGRASSLLSYGKTTTTTSTKPTSGGAGPVRVGLSAERTVAQSRGLEKNNGVFVGASGATRKPDFINPGSSVIEVKNVKYQWLSTQIKDYAAYAKTNNMQFELIMRQGGRVSAELDEFMMGENMVLTWIKF